MGGWMVDGQVDGLIDYRWIDGWWVGGWIDE